MFISYANKFDGSSTHFINEYNKFFHLKSTQVMEIKKTIYDLNLVVME